MIGNLEVDLELFFEMKADRKHHRCPVPPRYVIEMLPVIYKIMILFFIKLSSTCVFVESTVSHDSVPFTHCMNKAPSL